MHYGGSCARGKRSSDSAELTLLTVAFAGKAIEVRCKSKLLI